SAAIVLLTLLGMPAVFAVDRSVPPRSLLGLSFLTGAGLATLILLLLSLIGVAWSRGNFAGIALAVVAFFLWLAIRRGRGLPGLRLAHSKRASVATVAMDACTLLAVVGHGIYATLAPLGQWDFWTDWGLKAKVFWFHRGVDWAFLSSPANFYAHRDYPPLLPLTMDFFSLVRGGWEDRWIGLLFTAFAAALLLVARDLMSEEIESQLLASFAALALAGPALVLWIGLAEGPLIAYGSLAVLMLRRALGRGGPSWTWGALLLGGAALTKNEGVALIGSAALALLAAERWRLPSLLRLAPAAALAAVWLLPRSIHALTSELLEAGAGSRLLARISEPGPFLAALGSIRWHRPLLWAAAAAAFLLIPGSVRRERFFLINITLQILILFLIYATSPHPLPWHVHNSSERFSAQQTFALSYVAAALLLTSLRLSAGPRALAAGSEVKG
ncbi:MAG TPA: hypothetical protein VEG84_04005, partial [Thermoanaerobaculia bacterium]|nr:hypothetical protein [Thermoanaerobaculia bacterium]